MPWTVLLFTLGKKVIVDGGQYSADGSGDSLPQALLHSSHGSMEKTSSHVQLLPASEEAEGAFERDGGDNNDDDDEDADARDCGDVEMASATATRSRLFRTKWAPLGTNNSSGSSLSSNMKRLPVSTTGKEWVRSPFGQGFEEADDEDEEFEEVPLPGLNGAVIRTSDEESDNDNKHDRSKLSTELSLQQSPSRKSPNLSPDLSPNSSSPPQTSSTWQRIYELATREITITASLTSVLLACSGPLKRPFYAPGPLSFVGGAIAAVGAPSPVVSTLVLSSGLYSSFAALLRRRFDSSTTTTTAPASNTDAAANAAEPAGPKHAAASSSSSYDDSPSARMADTSTVADESKSLELPPLDSSAHLHGAPSSPSTSAPTLTWRATSSSSRPAVEKGRRREHDSPPQSLSPSQLPYAPPPLSLALLAVCLKLVRSFSLAVNLLSRKTAL